MQGGNNLKIYDDEYSDYKEKMNELASLFESKISSYIYIIQSVCNNGISDGNVHDNLLTFLQALNLISGQLTLLTTEMGLESDKFIEEIDNLDRNLYESY